MALAKIALLKPLSLLGVVADLVSACVTGDCSLELLRTCYTSGSKQG